jgi:hypothetical protein
MMPAMLLLFASLQPEPGDWPARRGEAALAIDQQPGNVDLWSSYCLAAWRGGDQKVLKSCERSAPGPISQVATAVLRGALANGESSWALRVQIEGNFSQSRFDEARRAAQRLYELEPDNSWALETAILAAFEAQDTAMAAALARRGDERFGGKFSGYSARAKQRLSSRHGRADWLFLAGIMVLVWVSFRQARRHGRAKSKRGKPGRGDVNRLASASVTRRESLR